ncbi:unnamed protein product [Mytilus coruscus]|uniref:Integrase catalytic domain-containing protein n=1 Tax=Mytilus coruscus TaxID=42192 RepID=A0A6J8BDK7_MYTCO|nr:unnamed protein product [Mytilus coruscus]
MKNKIKLRQTREYNRVYIEDELTREAQVYQTNMMAILKGMGRDKDFVFVNGKIKNKGNTHRRNETERTHEQSERNDRNEWRTVRGRNTRGRGKSVVDYILTPHDQINDIIDFQVHTMSTIISRFDLAGYESIPDHSLLECTISTYAENTDKVEQLCENERLKAPRRFRYDGLRNELFSDEPMQKLLQDTILRLENALDRRRDVDSAFKELKNLLITEIELTCKEQKQNIPNKRHHKITESHIGMKSFKIYGIKNARLKRNGRVAKRTLNRRYEVYTCKDGKTLIHLTGNQNVRTENGEVTNDTDTVLERWKTEYESAFNSVDSCNNYDDTFLADIKNRVQNENNYRNDIDDSDLNREISREEVKDAVYKAKLGGNSFLDKVFSTFGIPNIVKTDNGSPWQGKEFRDFATHMGFTHRKITPLWPQSNAECERFMRSIGKSIRAAHTQHKNWKQEMFTFLRNYRATKHATTDVSPAKLLFGRNIKTKLPTITPKYQDNEIRETDKRKKDKMKNYADTRRNAEPSDLKIGDTVLVRQDKQNKLSTPYNSNPYKNS